jgi:uncharacterized protein (DUF4415 family)
MPKKSPPLRAKELKEIESRRAEAREWARKFLSEPIDEEEEARLTAAAESDPDNPPLTDEQLREMRPFHEVHPELAAKWLRRGRGRPRSEAPKQQVTLRLDRDVLEKFRAGGAGWQSRINKALRKAAGV